MLRQTYKLVLSLPSQLQKADGLGWPFTTANMNESSHDVPGSLFLERGAAVFEPCAHTSN